MTLYRVHIGLITSNNAHCACITSAFVSEPRRMVSINQCFGTHYRCHFQGEWAGSGLRRRFDGADWWIRVAHCAPARC
jgi:hypothetical protein